MHLDTPDADFVILTGRDDVWSVMDPREGDCHHGFLVPSFRLPNWLKGGAVPQPHRFVVVHQSGCYGICTDSGRLHANHVRYLRSQHRPVSEGAAMVVEGGSSHPTQTCHLASELRTRV